MSETTKPNHLALATAYFIWLANLWLTDTAVTLIGLFTLIAAIVKGPLMLVWGTIYSALVALFPPFALVLSFTFFIINLGTVMKSWRITLTSAYFYLVPLGFSLLKTTNWVSTPYFLTGLALLSILGLHFILEWLYKNNSLGRLLTWQIISVPFSLTDHFTKSPNERPFW